MGVLPSGLERVLLIHPPVYDIRFPWPRWQQPTWLLRIASHYRTAGADLRLIDAIRTRPGERLPRTLRDRITEDDTRLQKWRFGLPERALAAEIQALKAASWVPDRVFVQCFAGFWWEGADEAVRAVWKQMPDAPVTLVGPRASAIRERAFPKGARVDVLEELPGELAGAPNDLALCPSPPSLLYVSLDNGERAPTSAEEEVKAARKRGVRHAAFVGLGSNYGSSSPLVQVLDLLATHPPGVNLYALGSMRAADVAANPELPALMRGAGYVEIYFADDRDSAVDGSDGEALIESYRQAAALCHRAGFKARTHTLTGGVCVGRPGEDLGERARLTTLVAHHIGAVIPWPYQPTPRECRDRSLEAQNGKLFPLREANGRTYSDYANFLGFAALLNAKYRDRTFDFLGDGLIPTLFRDSLAHRAWEPPEEVKGPLQLPILQHP